MSAAVAARAVATAAVAADGRAGEVVVLLHGFMANRWLLVLLANRLRRQGWQTSLWGYPSLMPSVIKHGERFAKRLSELDAAPGSPASMLWPTAWVGS